MQKAIAKKKFIDNPINSPRLISKAEINTKYDLTDYQIKEIEKKFGILKDEYFNLNGAYPYVIDFINYICTFHRNDKYIRRKNDNAETHYLINTSKDSFFYATLGHFENQRKAVEIEIYRTLNKIDIALKINNKEELRNFMNEVNNGNTFENQYVYLMENIDLTGETWDVIGSYTDDTTNKAFAGIFEGNNRTINGLNINKSQDFVGLFAYNTGTIRDIILESGSITGNARVGGILAVNTGLIENCHNKGVTINFTSDSVGGGGICARSTGEIAYCSNSSNITSNTTLYVGGIVGALNYTKIKNCYNLGNIEGVAIVGGVIGNSIDSEIQFCYNTGDITGTGMNSNNGTYVGGIIGSFHKNSMKGCYNSGKIKCEYIHAGGIAGENYGGNIKNCYNIGIILKCSNYGNICGGVYKEATIENCYFSKAITNIDGVGYTNVETKQETINKDLNYMKSNDFITDLNKDEDVFTIDNNLNNGYPILKWQID